MPLRSGRGLLVGFAVFAVIASTALGVNRTVSGSRVASAASTVQYSQGMSGTVAAKALNALAAKSQKKSTKSLTTVTFLLNWLPNVEFAGLWIAQKYGWWAKAGLKLNYVPYSQSSHPETDVPARGGTTFGFQAGAAIAIAKAHGVPIQALYTDTQRSVFGLTVLNSSHINKITDLKGKKVGYQPHELYVPETMLASAGLKPTQWKPTPVLFDTAPLTQHQVDAFLTFLTNEPINLRLAGVNVHSFSAAANGYHFYDDVLFTYLGLINKNSGLVKKVVTNVAKGFQYAHTHTDFAARLTVSCCFHSLGTGETASKHLEQQILEMRKFSKFSRNSKGQFTGLMTRSYWQDSINTLYKYKEIKTKPSAAAIYTNRFNPYK